MATHGAIETEGRGPCGQCCASHVEVRGTTVSRKIADLDQEIIQRGHRLRSIASQDLHRAKVSRKPEIYLYSIVLAEKAPQLRLFCIFFYPLTGCRSITQAGANCADECPGSPHGHTLSGTFNIAAAQSCCDNFAVTVESAGAFWILMYLD